MRISGIFDKWVFFAILYWTLWSLSIYLNVWSTCPSPYLRLVNFLCFEWLGWWLACFMLLRIYVKPSHLLFPCSCLCLFFWLSCLLTKHPHHKKEKKKERDTNLSLIIGQFRGRWRRDVALSFHFFHWTWNAGCIFPVSCLMHEFWSFLKSKYGSLLYQIIETIVSSSNIGSLQEKKKRSLTVNRRRMNLLKYSLHIVAYQTMVDFFRTEFVSQRTVCSLYAEV